MPFNDLIKSADWKKEKHTPVIEAPTAVKKGETIKIEVSVGKEIPHPNTTSHHIAWLEVYFFPKNSKFPYLLSKVDFSSHGASIEGPDTSGVYTEPSVSINFTAQAPGTICALSYCNIHGLWENSSSINVVE